MLRVKDSYINVFSEIGKLKKVLVHEPDLELERLVPQFLERMLFDDIPYLRMAKQEHQAFVNILKSQGTEVVYLKNLLKETLSFSEEAKNSLIHQFIEQSLSVLGVSRGQYVERFLQELTIDELLLNLMSGVLKKDLSSIQNSFYNLTQDEDPFLIDPLPNLYFTRDPAASIGKGLSFHRMYFQARRKEALFLEHIFKYHPEIKKSQTPFLYNSNEPTALEGGDILVLSKECVVVGVSQRTSPLSIEVLAKNIFDSKQSFNKVYAVVLPSKREFMHLDTVFTMVSHKDFIVHPAVMDNTTLKVFSLTQSISSKTIQIREEKSFLAMLRNIIHDEPSLISCGGGGFFNAAREQWNDGSNTLAISPAEVMTYKRNELSNKILEDHGIKVHSFEGSELVRGRGGPHCMSMALYRDDL